MLEKDNQNSSIIKNLYQSRITSMKWKNIDILNIVGGFLRRRGKESLKQYGKGVVWWVMKIK